MRILFQGDSITDGNRLKDPALAWDKNHQIGHCYAYIVNGLLGLHYPQKNLEFVNRGVSGEGTYEILKRIQRDILDVKPDVLSLYVGVNDGSASEHDPEGCPPEVYEQRYREIIDRTQAEFPSVKLLFIAPYIYERQPMTQAYRRRMELVYSYAEIVRRLSREYGAALVDLQPEFDACCQLCPVDYWCWDGVHPTENGHGLIAEEWIKAFRTLVDLER